MNTNKELPEPRFNKHKQIITLIFLILSAFGIFFIGGLPFIEKYIYFIVGFIVVGTFIIAMWGSDPKSQPYIDDDAIKVIGDELQHEEWFRKLNRNQKHLILEAKTEAINKSSRFIGPGYLDPRNVTEIVNTKGLALNEKQVSAFLDAEEIYLRKIGLTT